MIKGKCNCEAVTFEVSTELTDVYMCHCSICRKFTGNTGAAVVVVKNEDFRWLTGNDHIASWKKSDADWQAWFCKACGSPLPGKNSDSHMFIHAGLLPDGLNLKVAHHIWVDSKADWDEIGDSGKLHPESFSN